MKNPFSLEGKVAIVTGGSKGIGLSIAHHLAAMGAKVAIASRKIEACEAAAQEIRDAGGEAMAVACNISRRDECEALVAKTHEAWGRLDIFVANAAVNPVYGPLADLTDEAFNKVMTSNVHSAIWFANAAMPHMAEAGGGAFIIVSSIPGGIRHFENSGCRCHAIPRGGVGAEEYHRQLHHAGAHQDRFRPRPLGERQPARRPYCADPGPAAWRS